MLRHLSRYLLHSLVILPQMPDIGNQRECYHTLCLWNNGRNLPNPLFIKTKLISAQRTSSIVTLESHPSFTFWGSKITCWLSKEFMLLDPMIIFSWWSMAIYLFKCIGILHVLNGNSLFHKFYSVFIFICPCTPWKTDGPALPNARNCVLQRLRYTSYWTQMQYRLRTYANEHVVQNDCLSPKNKASLRDLRFCLKKSGKSTSQKHLYWTAWQS